MRSTGVLAGVGLASLFLVLVGPPYLRHGAVAVLKPTLNAAEANPYSIFVEPGNVTISRGSDQAVLASLNGFTAEDATLFRRSGDETQYGPVPMIAADSVGFEALLFGVDEATDYFVESSGGPPRKYYRIAPAGREQLAAWEHEWERLSEGVKAVLNGGERG